MTKLQMHTSADVATFQYGTSPGRARNGHPNWFWAVLGMSRDKRVVIAQKHNLVTVILGLNLQYSRRWQIVEEYAPFDFRLHDVPIHFIGEIGMTAE